MLLLVSDVCDVYELVFFDHCIFLHKRMLLLFSRSTVANINDIISSTTIFSFNLGIRQVIQNQPHTLTHTIAIYLKHACQL